MKKFGKNFIEKNWFMVGAIGFFIVGVAILFSSSPVFTGQVILENFTVFWNRVIGAMFIVMGLVAGVAFELNQEIKATKKKRGLENIVTDGRDAFGLNVELHTTFMRHGEKDKEGLLTETGAQQAQAYGASIKQADAIQAYSSVVERSIETTANAIAAARHTGDYGLGKSPAGRNIRLKKEISMPDIFDTKFGKELMKRYKQSPEDATNWYFAQGSKASRGGSLSATQLAEGFAYILKSNMGLSNKIYSNSKVNLINGTHQLLPECLLREVMIREVDGKKVVGFDKIEEIGGLLNYAEPVDFVLKRDDIGDYDMKVNFRGHTFDVDMNRLNKLADNYARRTGKEYLSDRNVKGKKNLKSYVEGRRAA